MTEQPLTVAKPMTIRAIPRDGRMLPVEPPARCEPGVAYVLCIDGERATIRPR